MAYISLALTAWLRPKHAWPEYVEGAAWARNCWQLAGVRWGCLVLANDELWVAYNGETQRSGWLNKLKCWCYGWLTIYIVNDKQKGLGLAYFERYPGWIMGSLMVNGDCLRGLVLEPAGRAGSAQRGIFLPFSRLQCGLMVPVGVGYGWARNESRFLHRCKDPEQIQQEGAETKWM